MIKNTLNKALQHHRQAAPQSIKTALGQMPESNIISTKVATKSSSGAHSHREKSGFQMLINASNQGSKQLDLVGKTKVVNMKSADSS